MNGEEVRKGGVARDVNIYTKKFRAENVLYFIQGYSFQLDAFFFLINFGQIIFHSFVPLLSPPFALGFSLTPDGWGEIRQSCSLHRAHLAFGLNLASTAGGHDHFPSDENQTCYSFSM